MVHTEQALLTYGSIEDVVKGIYKNVPGIVVPIGISPFGTLEHTYLLDDEEESNMLVYSVPGSGKSEFMKFVLKSLIDLYGDELAISYIGDSGDRVQQWLSVDGDCKVPNPNITDYCTDVAEFKAAISKVKDYIENRRPEDKREVIILDNIMGLLKQCDTRIGASIDYMLRKAPTLGVHFIVAIESDSSEFELPNCNGFNIVCSTRTNEAISEALYGNAIGTAVKKCGEIVYSYNWNQSKLRVPFMGFEA